MILTSVGAEAASLMAALHAAAFDAPWPAAEFAKLAATPTAEAIVAQTHEPLGFVLSWAPGGEAEILTLCVAPGARRQGVAAALMDAAIASARARGAAAMLLEVADDNLAARALYARLGFVELARRRDYYTHADRRVDALVLRCALERP